MTIVSKIRKSRGFTLVELMIVVVIIGILAALAIFGVKRYVTNSKTAEARMALGRMSKDATTAYEGEKMDGTGLLLGKTIDTSRALCLSASNSVPANMQPDGVKYQPAAVDWAEPDTLTGWQCLKFTMDQPIYFTYDYQTNYTGGTPAAGNWFTASAKAALGGAEKSLFLNGLLRADAAANNALVLTTSPAICEDDTQSGLGAKNIADANVDCIAD